jgi:endoglucanase
MVTNLCPNNGNAVWCPTVGGTNQYGYSYHFDIMFQSETFGDNPVVNFEPVACPGQAVTDWEQCVCYDNVALATDTTPVGLTTGGSVPPTTSTTSAKSSTTSAKTSTTSTTSSSGGTAPEYGQCGGIGWTGPTACVSGTTCNVLNAYYSQCLA